MSRLQDHGCCLILLIASVQATLHINTTGFGTTRFELGNTSFSLSAPAYFATVRETIDKSFDASARGCIILIDYSISGNAMYKFANSCRVVSCAGIVLVGATTHGLLPWYYRQQAPPPFTDVPMLLLLTLKENLHGHIKTGDRITIDSTNHASDRDMKDMFDRHWPAVAFAVTALVNVAIIVFGAIKMIDIYIEVANRGRSLMSRPLPIIVIGTVMITSCTRFVCTFNVGFLRMQAFTYGLVRFTLTAFMPLHVVSMAAMSVSLCTTWMESNNLKSPRRMIAIKLSCLSLAALVVFDLGATYGASIAEEETLGSGGVRFIAGTYFIMSIPANIAFIIYGGRISKQLLSVAGIDDKDRVRRVRFALHIRYSGAVGLIFLSLLALSGILISTSPFVGDTVYLGVFNLGNFFSSIQGAILISAFRTADTLRNTILTLIRSKYIRAHSIMPAPH